MKYLYGLLVACSLFGQTPDVRVPFGPWTDVNQTVAFDNRTQGIYYWVLTYQTSGCSAVALAFQSATGLNAPGSFGNFSGTVATGINPNTSTAGATTTFTGAPSWYRVAFTSGASGASCTISGVVNGYKTGYALGGAAASGAAGCPGTTVTPCVVVGETAAGSAPTTAPALVAGQDGAPGNIRTILTDSLGRQIETGPAASGAALAGNPIVQGQSDGANAQNVLTCRNTVIFNDSSSGNTQIVALSGSTKIYVCKLTVSTAAAVNVQLTQGTGSNCGTGTANLSGLYQFPAAGIGSDDFAADSTYLISGAAQALCLNLSGTVNATGTVSYAQF